MIVDCVAVKGDYFYLKKGEKVKINFEIKGYVEVEHKEFHGYFPANLFKFSE